MKNLLSEDVARSIGEYLNANPHMAPKLGLCLDLARLTPSTAMDDTGRVMMEVTDYEKREQSTTLGEKKDLDDPHVALTRWFTRGRLDGCWYCCTSKQPSCH